MAKKETNIEVAIFQMFEDLKADIASLQNQNTENQPVIDFSSIEERLEELRTSLKDIGQQDNSSLILQLEDITKKIESIKQPRIDVLEYQMRAMLQGFYNSLTQEIHSIKKKSIEGSEVKIFIDSKWLLIIIGIVTTLMIIALTMFRSERTQRLHLEKNDLKYRYIQMQGKATTDDILWLDRVFKAPPTDSIIVLIRESVELNEENRKKKKDSK